MLRVGLPLHQTGPDQRIDRTADGRSSALHRRGNFIERSGLSLGDRRQQLAARRLGPFGGSIRHPLVDDRREPRGERRRRVREGKLLHNNSLNSNKVVRVKPRLRLRFSGSRAMPRR